MMWFYLKKVKRNAYGNIENAKDLFLSYFSISPDNSTCMLLQRIPIADNPELLLSIPDAPNGN